MAELEADQLMCFPLNTASAVAGTGVKKPWSKMWVLQADGPSANPTSTCVGPRRLAFSSCTGWVWSARARVHGELQPLPLPSQPAMRAAGIHAASQRSWQLQATIQDHFVFSVYHSCPE